MPSTWSRGEPIFPFDPEHNRTLQKMNNPQNKTNLGDGINCQLPPPVYAHNQVVAEYSADDALRMQPPIPRPQEFYRENVNITDSNGPSFPTSSTAGAHVRGNYYSDADAYREGFVFRDTILGSTCSHSQTKVVVQELCREDILGHKSHRFKSLPCLTDGKGRDMVYLVAG